MEREEEREREGGAVVRFTRSVREATVPLIIANRAGAGGGCSPLQMTDPPSPLSLAGSSILIYLTLHGARVELAHVDALVVELDVGDM